MTFLSIGFMVSANSMIISYAANTPAASVIPGITGQGSTGSGASGDPQAYLKQYMDQKNQQSTQMQAAQAQQEQQTAQTNAQLKDTLNRILSLAKFLFIIYAITTILLWIFLITGTIAMARYLKINRSQDRIIFKK